MVRSAQLVKYVLHLLSAAAKSFGGMCNRSSASLEAGIEPKRALGQHQLHPSLQRVVLLDEVRLLLDLHTRSEFLSRKRYIPFQEPG